jgi:glycine reductase
LGISERHGAENVVVVLGSPDRESVEIFAETVVNGDPSYVGPLAGKPLNLAVFHILEPEIKAAADADVYEEQVGLMEDALPADELVAAIRRVRAS